VEVIVVDDDSSDSTVAVARSFGARIVRNGARHIERGKALGIRAAKHELILFLDADNFFVRPDWLREAVGVLEGDRSLVGAESARFHYDPADPAANRYCALLGINDPLAFYLKRRDRLTDWEQEWCLMGSVDEDCGSHWKVSFQPEAVPTLGSQGYLTRKSLIRQASHWPFFFHMDANLELIQKGHRRFALLKQPIGHDHCASLAGFAKKCGRNLDLFFKYRAIRRYDWKTSPWSLAWTVLSMVTVLRPLLDAGRGFWRRRDPAWFLHPILCLEIPLLYAFKTMRHRLVRA
jgi:glycosyltransferase involved in cell wall biosynthesis